jgi:choline dehydrogenase-like flavoprotein
VIYDEQQDRAAGVQVVDAETLAVTEYFARIIFLNASTINTAAILLNSATPRFSEGLGNSSGQLGKNLMDHHFMAGARGEIPGFEDQHYYGRRPNGVYVPRFRNLGGERSDYIRGFGYQGLAMRSGWGRGMQQTGFGADFKDQLAEPGPWIMNFTGFGECLPYPGNFVNIDPTRQDKWGMPIIQIVMQFRENERAMRPDMVQSAAEMLEAAGAKQIQPYDEGAIPGLGIHEMGTARMGRDPRTSVLNAWNQMHDVPNVFITDGSCMTSSACQNPSLTYMALTARACDYAVRELKRGNL